MAVEGNGRPKWQDASATNPCVICGKADWCSRDESGQYAICRRLDRHPTYGIGKVKADASGGTYWSYRLVNSHESNGTAWPAPKFTLADGGGKRADSDTLDKVYTRFLQYSSLDAEHCAAIQQRGVEPQLLRKRGYGVLNKRRASIIQRMIREGLEESLPRVPGFYVSEKNGKRFWSFAGPSGLLIPIRDPQGRIVGILIRPDKVIGAKYIWASSKKHGGASAGAPIHVPLFDGEKFIICVTEGGLKADIATVRSGRLYIALPGVNSWRKVARTLKSLGAKTVRIALDADGRQNPHVALAIRGLVDVLRQRGYDVELEIWELAEAKGIDDLLVRGMEPDVVSGEAVAMAVAEIVAASGAGRPTERASASDPHDHRRIVLIEPDEYKVVNEAVAALAECDREIYQRAGSLVQVISEPSPKSDRIKRPEGASRIVPVLTPALRTRLTQFVRFRKVHDEGTEKERVIPSHPPDWIAPCIAAAQQWPGIRPLVAKTESPIIRADGTICQTPGYDVESGILYRPICDFPEIPEAPTQADAARAAESLCEVVCDFPFSTPDHRAVWVAFLLTILARLTIDGNVPLFAFTANIRGSGKGLLVQLASLIATGRYPPTSTYSSDTEETRKSITSAALAGDSIILFDNVAEVFGNSHIDAALTTSTWTDRKLGTNERPTLPLATVFALTGNNVMVRADTARRVIECNLESSEERPEDRTEFRHKNVVAWVKNERSRLVCNALTMLSAYFKAGRPSQNLPPWGSFEEWSDLIRGAVVWAGLPDPAGTRRSFTERADTDAAALRALIDNWIEIDPDGSGLTVNALLTKLEDREFRTAYPNFRSALAEFCPAKFGELPTRRALGYRLRQYAKRNIGGRCIDSTKLQGFSVWKVVGMSASQRRGDGGDRGDVSGNHAHATHARTHTHARTDPAETSPPSPPSPQDDRGDAWEGDEIPF